MLRRTSLFLFSLPILLQISSGSPQEVDSVVEDCQNKVSDFAATEDKYETTSIDPTEPTLFGEIIQSLHSIVYEVEQNQRVFECIADKLHDYSDQDLEKSPAYQNLTDKCESDRPIVPDECDSSYPYRTINATCNNLNNTRWGSTLNCLLRLFPANYEGVSGFRKSVCGDELPPPRNLSLNIVKPRLRLSRHYNDLLIFFGQAVAHDLVEMIFTTVNGSALDCCRFAGTNEQHPQCEPIFPPRNDPFYSPQNISCLGFDRMAPCYTCSVGKRIQINQVTSYIDCSLVYGQIDDRAENLRRNDGSGKLRSQDTEAGELLPGNPNSGNTCARAPPAAEQYCFSAGDTRTNQHSMISMLHTIFLREHNRIADALRNLNEQWDEERLYQESRKILIAEFQVIIYNEFLPELIGEKLMSKYELHIGDGSGYDPTVDATISIEFNTAAFRIHTLVPGHVVPHEEYEYFRTLFINAAPVYNGRTSAYLSKMANYPAERQDWYMPIDLTDYLYRRNHGTYGFDLAAVNIQRGRDSGLPTYSQVIEYLENRTGSITKFHDLNEYLVPKCLHLLEENYHDVRDIDLWLGLNCERTRDDIIVSPTAAKIIAEQFRRLKFGDRFYFEYDDTFTDDQKETLLHASLAKMICDNTDVSEIQPLSMLFPSENNMPTSCFNISDVDLELWRE